jgi:hypothetical protein
LNAGAIMAPKGLPGLPPAAAPPVAFRFTETLGAVDVDVVGAAKVEEEDDDATVVVAVEVRAAAPKPPLVDLRGPGAAAFSSPATSTSMLSAAVEEEAVGHTPFVWGGWRRIDREALEFPR